jgi:hypothetical protein
VSFILFRYPPPHTYKSDSSSQHPVVQHVDKRTQGGNKTTASNNSAKTARRQRDGDGAGAWRRSRTRLLGHVMHLAGATDT